MDAIVVVLLLIAVSVLAGVLLTIASYADERRALQEQRQALDAEWRALDSARRLRAVFLHARRAMQDEAQRRSPWHRPGGPR